MSEKILNHLKDITTCSICNDTLKNQRALPCIHTFCCDCLKQYVSQRKKQPGDKVPCPLCREEFTIPAGNVTDLNKNFFIEDLLELLGTHKSQSPVECDVCKANSEEVDDILPATMYCIDCRENMCNTCSKEHKRQKLSRAHHVVPSGDEINEEMLGKFSPHFCDVHADKQMEIYCFDCKIVVCVKCFLERHKQHKSADIRMTAEKFKFELGNVKENIYPYEAKAFDIEMELEEKKTDFLKSICDTEQQVVAAGNQLKSIVDERVKFLLKELNLVKENFLKEFASDHEQLDAHIAALQSLKTYISALAASGSSHDICQSANDLKTRISALQVNLNSLSRQWLMETDVNFMPSDFDQDEFVGKIQTNKREAPSGKRLGPYCSERKRVSALDKEGEESRTVTCLSGMECDMVNVLIASPTCSSWMVVNKLSSVNDLFDRIALIVGIRKVELRLLYKGRSIQAGYKRLMDHGICHGSTLHAVRALKGE